MIENLYIYSIIIKCLFEVCQSKQSIEMTDINVSPESCDAGAVPGVGFK